MAAIAFYYTANKFGVVIGARAFAFSMKLFQSGCVFFNMMKINNYMLHLLIKL